MRSSKNSSQLQKQAEKSDRKTILRMHGRDVNAKQLKNVLIQKWYIDKFHAGEILCALTIRRLTLT